MLPPITKIPRDATQGDKAQTRPEGIGPKCPKCGSRARLDNGDCVYCAARAAAEQSGRSAADALLLAAGRRIEHAIDQARHQG